MSQMSYADAHLETALTAMFERKVNENRSSMRYWPTVSDRLGEQVSRRPWEYVMDAIYKLRLPVKPQYVQSAGGALVVVIAVLLLILFMNTDDTSNGGSAPADSPQQTVPESGGADPGAVQSLRLPRALQHQPAHPRHRQLLCHRPRGLSQSRSLLPHRIR